MLQSLLLDKWGYDHVQVGKYYAEKESRDQEYRNKDLEEFENSTTKFRILCATKALGRGVHISGAVRFVFHAAMPLSLTEVGVHKKSQ